LFAGLRFTARAHDRETARIVDAPNERTDRQMRRKPRAHVAVP